MNRLNVAGIAHLCVGCLTLAGIWIALPARYLLVDVLGTLVGLAALGAAAGVLLRRSWGLSLARGVAWLELIAGTLTVSAVAWSAAALAGSYGPVGDGGALLMTTVALLVLPYLVVLPAAQLVLLRDAA
jgi:hypothetical protein